MTSHLVIVSTNREFIVDLTLFPINVALQGSFIVGSSTLVIANMYDTVDVGRVKRNSSGLHHQDALT
jgi:hypothetical protein